MVFEQIFNIKEVKNNYFNIFVMGFIFSEIGILASFIAFNGSVGLMSVAFTSVIGIPFLLHLLELKTSDTDTKSFFKNLFWTNSAIFESYVLLFLGFFFSYVLYSLFLPEHSVLYYFQDQLSLFNISGTAIGIKLSFRTIILNNFKVLLIFFILSIIFGVGSILFLVWNASVWGILLGYFIKLNSTGSTLFIKLINTMLKFFPHMILEASCYLFAIISGVIISQTITNKSIQEEKKKEVIIHGVILYIISVVLLFVSAYVEVYVYPLL
ncbi:MAG: stage II sporulation protein M [Candidatus Woesearchaeota archaeon]